MGLFVVVSRIPGQSSGRKSASEGMSVSFIDCSAVEEEALADESPGEAVGRESTSQAKGDETGLLRENARNQAKQTRSIRRIRHQSWSFVLRSLDQLDDFKLRCSDADPVPGQGYWWANIDQETADSCGDRVPESPQCDADGTECRTICLFDGCRIYTCL